MIQFNHSLFIAFVAYFAFVFVVYSICILISLEKKIMVGPTVGKYFLLPFKTFSKATTVSISRFEVTFLITFLGDIVPSHGYE